ncbi:unnamed protein product [Mucor hiemalis]
MTDKYRKSTQFVSGWPTSHTPSPESVKTSSIHEEYLDVVPLNELQQGELYIIKIKLIAIALFQGWDDDMCCFTILRTDLLEELRWSEARYQTSFIATRFITMLLIKYVPLCRYLPENFDAYLAFDYAGNPPIHLWTKQLRAVIPINWFNIFEEARHMQRQWNVSYWDQPAQIENAISQQTIAEEGREDENQTRETKFYNLTDSPVPDQDSDIHGGEDFSEKIRNNDEEEYGTVVEVAPKEIQYSSSPQSAQKITSHRSVETPTTRGVAQYPSLDATTPAMRLQKQYNVAQQQQKQIYAPQTPLTATKSSPTSAKTEKRPEIKQRRSFTSFFLKKKKSKSFTEDDTKKNTKRKSAPPTPSINEKYFKGKADDNRKSIVDTKMPAPPLTTSNSSSSSVEEDNTQLSPDEAKTPKNELSSTAATTTATADKYELFDIDSYFDMQATFAFLNNTTDKLSLMDSVTTTASTKKSALAN